MRTVRTVAEALEPLAGQQGLWLLLEDWEHGLQLGEGCSPEEVIQAVQSAYERYGNGFTFRAFNRAVDVLWNGELGIICVGDPGPTETVYLEGDYRRFPGVRAFRKVESLAERLTQAKVAQVHWGDALHLRLVELKEGS